MTFVEKLISVIADETADAAVLGDALQNAGFIFEKATLQHNTSEMGWPAEIGVSCIPSEEVALLRDAVVRLINREPTCKIAGVAIWALGKLQDEELEALFTAVIRTNVETNANTTYQALIALDTLGRFPEYQCWSIDAEDQNRERAHQWLALVDRRP